MRFVTRPPALVGAAALVLTVAVAGAGGLAPADASRASDAAAPTVGRAADASLARCSPGARSLAMPGSAMYPETGNGGYTSLHSGVFLRYDTSSGRFLEGTHVTLSELSTQCLTEFSLDFERHALPGLTGGPDLRVDSVKVDGRPATYAFVQPTYPGDANGPGDPDPRAHQVSQTSPVNGPDHNPLPPACSPSLANGSRALRYSQDGDPCPADKLVIHPAQPIPDRTTFTVTVTYHGRPGTHHDGDGNREGWFHTAGGSSMVTEPIGSESWMPLNNHPTSKPTYDFHITTNPGKTAIANGRLVSARHHPDSAEFPSGSVTWHWHAPFHIASYLALSMVGDYSLTSHVAADGMRYYEAQDRHISEARRQANQKVMDTQADITAFEEHFNGPFPFPTDGVVASIPGTSGDTEEMASMIVFTRGRVNAGTLYHENMHQWWGDNVSESSYETTFFKEGLAMLSQFLRQARVIGDAAGGAATLAGRGAFDHSLAVRFDHIYGHHGLFWIRAPSGPAPFTLFNSPPTYIRPGATYVALRAILGGQRFISALQDIQHRYGGSSITELQLEAEFHRFLPVQSDACNDRLEQFFIQWFDTGYPAGGGANRPTITGPGLDGRGFYSGACHR